MAFAIEASPVVGPATTAAPLRWCRAQSLDEIDGWEIPWRRLDRVAGNPLSGFSWMRAFLRAFSADVDPFFVGAMRDQELVALAPLVRKRLHGVRRLCLAGAGELHEPVGMCLHRRAGFRAAVFLAGPSRLPFVTRTDHRRLAGVEQDQTGISRPRDRRGTSACQLSVHRARRKLARSGGAFERRAPQRSAPGSPQGRATRRRNHRNSYSRPERTAAPDGRGLRDRSQKLERRGAQTALLHDAHRAAFYRQYAESACTEGVLRICFLRIGDRLAAMQLAIEQSDGFWLLKVGYDAKFSQCSPGLLLMRDTIRYAAEAGLRTYEFLGKAEAWTKVWTATEHACVSVRVYPFGLRGMAALAADSFVAARREVEQKRCEWLNDFTARLRNACVPWRPGLPGPTWPAIVIFPTPSRGCAKIRECCCACRATWSPRMAPIRKFVSSWNWSKSSAAECVAVYPASQAGRSPAGGSLMTIALLMAGCDRTSSSAACGGA